MSCGSVTEWRKQHRLVTLGDRDLIQFRQVLFKDALAPLEVPQQFFCLNSIESTESKAVHQAALPLYRAATILNVLEPHSTTLGPGHHS
jgi:hypothetical protein